MLSYTRYIEPDSEKSGRQSSSAGLPLIPEKLGTLFMNKIYDLWPDQVDQNFDTPFMIKTA